MFFIYLFLNICNFATHHYIILKGTIFDPALLLIQIYSRKIITMNAQRQFRNAVFDRQFI